MMLSRCRNSMVASVLLISSLLLGFVQAKGAPDSGSDDKPVTNLKLGNQTIERVSICLYSGHFFGCLSFEDDDNNFLYMD